MQRADESSLRDLLARVHERLSHAGTVDSETRRLLVALTHDIEHTLGRGAARGNSDPPARARPSLASLEGLAARFDADHPALAQSLRQLIDFLQKAGI
jgi:hypothetical protein